MNPILRASPEPAEALAAFARLSGKSKRQVIDAAITEYIERHRDEINAEIQSALDKLDGTAGRRIQATTGLSQQDLADVGGLPKSEG